MGRRWGGHGEAVDMNVWGCHEDPASAQGHLAALGFDFCASPAEGEPCGGAQHSMEMLGAGGGVQRHSRRDAGCQGRMPGEVLEDVEPGTQGTLW